MILNITGHEGDANQNPNEIPLHFHQDGYYQNKTKQDKDKNPGK